MPMFSTRSKTYGYFCSLRFYFFAPDWRAVVAVVWWCGGVWFPVRPFLPCLISRPLLPVLSAFFLPMYHSVQVHSKLVREGVLRPDKCLYNYILALKRHVGFTFGIVANVCVLVVGGGRAVWHVWLHKQSPAFEFWQGCFSVRFATVFAGTFYCVAIRPSCSSIFRLLPLQTVGGAVVRCNCVTSPLQCALHVALSVRTFRTVHAHLVLPVP